MPLFKIPLTKGYFAIVDKEDYPSLSKYEWQVLITGGKKYAVRRKWLRESPKKQITPMHRQIMNAPKGMTVDHINGNGLDNRKENLRIATISQNNANGHRKKKPRSGYVGVNRHGRGWMARISVGKKVTYLGTFDTAKKAFEAYADAHVKSFGEFSIYHKNRQGKKGQEFDLILDGKTLVLKEPEIAAA
jgi:hypothetical protein